MAEESKEIDPKTTSQAMQEVKEETAAGKAPQLASDSDDEPPPLVDQEADTIAEAATQKRKKSKKAKLKEVLRSPPTASETERLDRDMVTQLMEMNPALKSEYAGLDKDKMAEMIKKMDVAELLTGLAVTGKNPKDMASYKFWQTQPVPRFDEGSQAEEGEIKKIDPEQVPKEPAPMAEGYEWVTMDLTDEGELTELYQLLTDHYVEDDNAMFRFNYSIPFLNWYVSHHLPTVTY
jgi:glycylpeptide N-tetradecanoyltransferase